MDTKAYIASGILELYVLGKLPAESREEVERYAGQYPEIRAEIEAIEVSLEEYALLHGKQPPIGTLTDLLGKVPGPGPSSGLKSGVRTLWLLGLSLAASLLLLLWSNLQNRQLKTQADELRQSIADVQADCDIVRQQADQQERAVALLRAPDTRAVEMPGTELSPNSLARVFYNPQSRQAIFGLVSLPPAPAGKQYQLWAIVEGKPVDMGVLEIDPPNNELQDIPFIESAQAFAITLENEGGSPVPTLDQMYVVGNV